MTSVLTKFLVVNWICQFQTRMTLGQKSLAKSPRTKSDVIWSIPCNLFELVSLCRQHEIRKLTQSTWEKWTRKIIKTWIQKCLRMLWTAIQQTLRSIWKVLLPARIHSRCSLNADASTISLAYKKKIPKNRISIFS